MKATQENAIPSRTRAILSKCVASQWGAALLNGETHQKPCLCKQTDPQGGWEVFRTVQKARTLMHGTRRTVLSQPSQPHCEIRLRNHRGFHATLTNTQMCLYELSGLTQKGQRKTVIRMISPRVACQGSSPGDSWTRLTYFLSWHINSFSFTQLSEKLLETQDLTPFPGLEVSEKTSAFGWRFTKEPRETYKRQDFVS